MTALGPVVIIVATSVFDANGDVDDDGNSDGTWAITSEVSW